MYFSPFTGTFSAFLLFSVSEKVSVSDRKRQKKTCCHAETNDFDQQTAHGAPIYCSKYTTAILIFKIMQLNATRPNKGHLLFF